MRPPPLRLGCHSPEIVQQLFQCDRLVVRFVGRAVHERDGLAASQRGEFDERLGHTRSTRMRIPSPALGSLYTRSIRIMAGPLFFHPLIGIQSSFHTPDGRTSDVGRKRSTQTSTSGGTQRMLGLRECGVGAGGLGVNAHAPPQADSRP